MNTAGRFLQVFALGTWVGSILYFSAVVPQAAFRLFTPDDAGALVGVTLQDLHRLGVIAGVVFLFATVLRERSFGALARPAALLVALMIVLTLVSQVWVIAPMDALRFQMGSVAAATAGSPALVAFNKLHTASVQIEIGIFLSGLVAMFLTVRK